MKLYGAYSELEDYGMVSWHVVGFNLDFGEFWPVKTLHSRDAAEDLVARLNVEDHGEANNKLTIMQEFSKVQLPKKLPPKTEDLPCICRWPYHEVSCVYSEPRVQLGWFHPGAPGGPVPQADGDCEQLQTTRFPMQTAPPVETIRGNPVCVCKEPNDEYGINNCNTCNRDIKPKDVPIPDLTNMRIPFKYTSVIWD